MNKWKLVFFTVAVLLVAAVCSLISSARAQAPAAPAQNQAPVPKVGANATISASDAAVRGSREDPASVKRGADAYTANCGSCHGATAKGTDIGPDLVRSVAVEDDDKGSLIGPILHAGHPDKNGPKLNLTDEQITDIGAWLRVQVYGAAFRATYSYLNIVVGDPKKGEAYFNAKCGSCHSVTGDLAGIGAKYDPPTLQSRWVSGGAGGRGGRGRGGAVSANGSTTADITSPEVTKSTTTVTVTLADGQSFTGVPVSITDFNVVFRDMSGAYHSYTRNGEFPKVELHNPLQAHGEILRTLTDDDMHNVTAYLVTLK
jgi:cytochrome c oxidase cbb3-type subunit III